MPSSLSIVDHLSALTDLRQRRRVIDPRPKILLLVLCATLGSMDDFVEIQHRGERRLDFPLTGERIKMTNEKP